MRLLALALLLFLCFNCSRNKATGSMSLTELELKILDSIHHHEGVFAVAFQSLDTTEQTIYINKSTVFHAASTMKTPVMIEVYKQATTGNLQLQDSLTVTNKFRSIADSSWYELSVDDDSEPELYRVIGNKMQVVDLVEAMITRSSNLASNILIDRLGAVNITRTMEQMGATGMRVLRGVEDIKAFEKGLSNSTDAYSLMIIFKQLAAGKVVSEQASDQMVEVLKRQQFKDVIPALLPENVEVAHKTGSISGVHHDSGIIFLPDGRKYVLVLLSKDLKDFDKGTRLLQNISRMIYDYMVGN